MSTDALLREILEMQREMLGELRGIRTAMQDMKQTPAQQPSFGQHAESSQPPVQEPSSPAGNLGKALMNRNKQKQQLSLNNSPVETIRRSR